MKRILPIFFALAIAFNLKADWHQTEGLFGGEVYHLIKMDSVLIAGSRDGVHVSFNEGKNWILHNQGLTNTNISSMCKLGQWIFVGTDRGIFRSNDFGENWNLANGELIFVLRLVATNSNVFAVADNNKYHRHVFKADNQGNNWTLDTTIPQNINTYWNISANDSSVIMDYSDLGGSIHGLILSKNNGKTWSMINNLGGYLTGLEISNNKIFATLSNDPAVYISDNDGLTWKKQILPEIGKLKSRGDTIVVLGKSKFCVSYDLGNTWKVFDLGLTNRIVFTIFIDSNTLFVGTNLGIYKSYDNAFTWQHISDGLNGTDIKDIVYSKGRLFAIVNGKFIFAKQATQKRWELLDLGMGEVDVYKLWATKSAMLVSTSKGEYESKDNGNTWQINTVLTNISGINCLSVQEDNTYIVFWNLGLNLLYDNNSKIKQLNSPPSIFINCIYKYGNTLYAGGYGLFQSTDEGATWQQIGSDTQFNAIQYIRRDGNDLYVVTYSQLYHTDFNKIHWSSLKKPLAIYSFLIHNHHLYLGTDEFAGDIICSKDQGKNWQIKNEGLQGTRLYTLTAAGGTIYGGSSYQGMWQRNIAETAIDEENPIFIYPNPTTDLFSLASIKPIQSISIYTLTGQKIWHKSYTNGISSEDLSLHNCVNGIYLVVVSTGDKNYSVKIVKNQGQ